MSRIVDLGDITIESRPVGDDEIEYIDGACSGAWAERWSRDGAGQTTYRWAAIPVPGGVPVARTAEALAAAVPSPMPLDPWALATLILDAIGDCGWRDGDSAEARLCQDLYEVLQTRAAAEPYQVARREWQRQREAEMRERWRGVTATRYTPPPPRVTRGRGRRRRARSVA